MERGEQDRPPERRITRRSFLKRLVGLSGDGEDTSLLDTVILSTNFTLALVVTAPAALKLQESTGINIGNGTFTPEDKQWMKENPIPSLILGSVVAPAWEEGMFRVLPSFVLNLLSKSGTMWRVGIPSSTVFAGVHSFSVENPSLDKSGNQLEVKINSLPLYQFAEGLFLWKLVRDRGYLHSIVAHSVMNTTLFALNLLFPDPDNMDQLKSRIVLP